MSDYVTDAMVETAARIYHEAAPEAVAGSWDVSTPRIHERGLARARAALEAAAPQIAVAALHHVADELAASDGDEDGIALAYLYLQRMARKIKEASNG